MNALAADIRSWVNTGNRPRDPEPFGLDKTADEILERLGRYRADLTGTELVDGTA